LLASTVSTLAWWRHRRNEQILFMNLPQLTFRDLLLVPPQVIELIPESVARESLVLPLRQDSNSLELAVSDTSDTETFEKLRFILNTTIRLREARAPDLAAAIQHHYGPKMP
jgi:type IV pilus assembly protein PilB